MCWMQGKNYNIFNVLLKQSGDAINQSMALMHVSNDTLAKRVFLLSFPIKTKTIALALCVWGWYYFWLRSKPLNKQTINLAVFLFNQEPRPLYYWTWLAGGISSVCSAHTNVLCAIMYFVVNKLINIFYNYICIWSRGYSKNTFLFSSKTIVPRQPWPL